MRFLVLLPLLVALPQDPDLEPLLKAEARIKGAKSLRCTFEIRLGGEKVEGELRVFGEDRASLDLGFGRGERVQKFSARSDGQRVKVDTSIPRALKEHTPKEFATRCRTAVGLTLWTLFDDLDGEVIRVKDGAAKPAGSERIWGIETRIFSRDLEEDDDEEGGLLKTWIDIARGLPLKREYPRHGSEVVEILKEIEFDLPWKPEDFDFHSAKTIAAGREAQFRRGVESFQRFTGRPPKSGKDLVERPAWLEKDVFWPEGGFWSGPLPEVAYECSGRQAKVGGQPVEPATGRAIVAPTPRLADQFTARVRLEIAAAALEGYLVAYGTPPAKVEELWTRPAWAKAWPEGGFLPALPKDPWGKDLKAEPTKVAVEGYKEKSLRFKALGEAERKALEEGAGPRDTAEAEKSVRGFLPALKHDLLSVREEAMVRIVALGAPGVDALEVLLRGDTDPGSLAILASLRDKFPPPSPAWKHELALLSVRASRNPTGSGSAAHNERSARMSLMTCCTAEADFRSNDRDNNMVNDFWVKDIAGLCGIGADEASAIKLIEPSVARADASPARGKYPLFKDLDEPEPKDGYFFAVLLEQDFGPGKIEKYDKDGTGGHPDCFGFVAYPAEPGVTGTRTLIVNQDGTMWWKEAGEEPPTIFPLNPAADGWKKMD